MLFTISSLAPSVTTKLLVVSMNAVTDATPLFSFTTVLPFTSIFAFSTLISAASSDLANSFDSIVFSLSNVNTLLVFIILFPTLFPFTTESINTTSVFSDFIISALFIVLFVNSTFSNVTLLLFTLIKLIPSDNVFVSNFVLINSTFALFILITLADDSTLATDTLDTIIFLLALFV